MSSIKEPAVIAGNEGPFTGREVLGLLNRIGVLEAALQKMPRWKRFRFDVPASSWCLWRRKSDDYVFVGWHDYESVYRIDDPKRAICKIEEAHWAVIPCHEFDVAREAFMPAAAKAKAKVTP